MKVIGAYYSGIWNIMKVCFITLFKTADFHSLKGWLKWYIELVGMALPILAILVYLNDYIF